jgi:hypothetical protein
MGAFLNTSSVLQCPHGGSVNIVTSNSKVKADGDYVVRSNDTFIIGGCSFMLGNSPHPCVEVQWVTTAQKNQVVNDKVLTEDSVGLCVAGDKAPQGSVTISSTQSKVKGQ